jgi:apolipoprotein N-acyltransferase
MNIRRNILLALTSGLLLGLPWSVSSLFFVVFIAWVPLLLLEEETRHHANPYAIFNYAFVSFLLWNIMGTWWVAKPQLVGAILIIIANSLVQALVFWLASRMRTILRIPLLFPFGLIWMGYEQGSGLALAQPGQRTGHRAKAHPMVRVYRCSRRDALDHHGQLCGL